MYWRVIFTLMLMLMLHFTFSSAHREGIFDDKPGNFYNDDDMINDNCAQISCGMTGGYSWTSICCPLDHTFACHCEHGRPQCECAAHLIDE